MNAHPNILLIGTADTKADELLFLKTQIEKADGRCTIMDVGVLNDPPFIPETVSYTHLTLPTKA